MEGEFKLISKKKSRKRCPKNTKEKHTNASDYNHISSDDGDVFEDKLLSRINECRNELNASSFWADVKESWTKVETVSEIKVKEIISYGAGNFSTSPIARYQLAFLILFAEHLQLLDRVFIYDPIFTALERRIIQSFGFQLIKENEECKRKVTDPTVVFMFHCGKKMYDNLLRSNWNTNLENVVIIGNSFSSYLERFPSKVLMAEAPYLYDIITLSNEIQMKNTFIHTDIFNDTSFMSFPEKNLQGIESDFWIKTRPENMAEDNDTEIILRSKIDTFTGTPEHIFE